MKEIRHFVRLGFEEELFALFTFTKANHSPKESAASSNLGKKGSRELRRLSYSINYDSTCGSTSHGRVKGMFMCG